MLFIFQIFVTFGYKKVKNSDKKLSHFDIPSSVRKICDEALSYCYNLKSIFIPKTVTKIEDSPFVGCNRLASIEVDAANPNYRAEGNCCLTKNGKTLVFGCKTSSIPQGVERIDRWAFGRCKGLKHIEMPQSLKTVGEFAFYECLNLMEVRLNEGLTTIETWAFGGCEHLDSIEIPSTVTKIEQCAFDYCPCWKKIILLDSYERPD